MDAGRPDARGTCEQSPAVPPVAEQLKAVFAAPSGLDAAKRVARTVLGQKGVAVVGRARWALTCFQASWRAVQKPTDTRWLDVLADAAFKASASEVRDISVLDTARLANLWQWCGMSGDGAIIEVGAFRGGTALHLSNRWPNRRIFVCDTFAGFRSLALDPRLDTGITPLSWCNPDAAAVAALFSERHRDARIVAGTFPDAAASEEIAEISFAHIDVDIHESCRRSLDYISARMAPSALIVVNDYGRQKTRGVTRAVDDFLTDNPGWLMLPAYPGQAVLLDGARHIRMRRREGAVDRAERLSAPPLP